MPRSRTKPATVLVALTVLAAPTGSGVSTWVSSAGEVGRASGAFEATG